MGVKQRWRRTREPWINQPQYSQAVHGSNSVVAMKVSAEGDLFYTPWNKTVISGLI